MDGLEPPETELLTELHEAATTYVLVQEEWMTNELAYFSTARESKRLAANALIPEVNYRRRNFWLRLTDAFFTMNLDD